MLTRKLYILVLVTILVLLNTKDSFALPAFPGAEGQGASTIGGRGGTVYIVDTLSDNPVDGTTFREAATASGPRIIVFAVSGIIDLNSVLQISNPYITIAGETSPGGILISGWTTIIATHDVIMRNMRFRNGCQKCFAAGRCEDMGDTLSIYGKPKPYGAPARLDAYNIIVDHCSISWGCDETLDLAADYARVDSITVSSCIIAEGVNDAHPEPNHARGLFMWGKRTLPGELIRASFHRNLIMSFESRLPLANYNVSFDFINNVVYNFNSVLTPQVEPITGYIIKTNMIHNYIKPGPISGVPVPSGTGREINVVGDGSTGHMPAEAVPYPMIYTVGNIGYTRQTQIGDDWIVSEGWSPTNLLSKDYQSIIPFPSPGSVSITTTTMSESYADSIVDNVGAIKPSRDSVDIRLISEYKAGNKGNYINMADVVFPTFQHIPPLVDNDNDGMADAWEIARGLNISINDSSGDDDEDGYTNIEEYLHYLAGDSGSLPLTGDLNSDGKVDITDIQACVNHVLGAQDYGTKADVNSDGAVNVIDVQAIVNKILGL